MLDVTLIFMTEKTIEMAKAEGCSPTMNFQRYKNLCEIAQAGLNTLWLLNYKDSRVTPYYGVDLYSRYTSLPICHLCGEISPDAKDTFGKKVCPECQDIATLTNEPLPEYAHLLAWEDFKGCVTAGGFVNSDGYGNWATKTQTGTCADEVRPSKVLNGIQTPPKGYTHVAWYNK